MCNADGSVTAATCSECVDHCSSSECELMPDSTDCRYVLAEQSRSASTYLNYQTPSGVNEPAWWFQKLDILDASDSTFFASNGHRFGYSGFQVSEKSPYDGRSVSFILTQRHIL